MTSHRQQYWRLDRATGRWAMASPSTAIATAMIKALARQSTRSTPESVTKIDCGEITLIRFDGGGIAEIIVNSVKPISADMVVCAMTMNGIAAAKIIRTQTAQESPPPAVWKTGDGRGEP